MFSKFKFPSFKVFSAIAVLSLVVFCRIPVSAQLTLENERKRGVEILENFKKDIQKYYFDPAFGGRDLDALIQKGIDNVNRAPSAGYVYGNVATTIMGFGDAHTYFIPPPPPDHVQHGWTALMIGDKCYITAVKEGSDAESKGVKPGDIVLSMAGNTPTRKTLTNILFFVGVAPVVPVTIQKPDGTVQNLNLAGNVRKGKRVLNLASANGSDIFNYIRELENNAVLRTHHYVPGKRELFLWKMPDFDIREANDELMDKAQKSKVLIMDLRGNPGGSIENQQRLIGGFFDHDVKIADLKSRKETKPLMAKSQGKNVFAGKLIILMDSGSASSSEMFARIMQIEKRGIVIGDRSAGAVRVATYYPHRIGADLVFMYGLRITTADIVMQDGKGLEGAGVTPDELLVPTPEDLLAGRDPVMARAIELAGLKISPEDAAKIFPVVWRP